MKRFIRISILLVLLFSMLTVCISAETQHNGEENPPLVEVLRGTNRELIDAYLDPALFDDSMAGIDLENKPMLIVFTEPLYAYTNQPYEKTLQAISSEYDMDIVILEDIPTGLSRYLSDTKIGAYEYTVYSFLQDIIDGNSTQEFLGETCRINNVHCFISFSNYRGAAVVYETDKGRYVRFYADETAEAVEYTWDVYVDIARDYFAYISAWVNNYDIFGNPLVGVSPTFLEFATNPSQYKVDYLPLIIPGALLLICVLVLINARIQKRKADAK